MTGTAPPRRTRLRDGASPAAVPAAPSAGLGVPASDGAPESSGGYGYVWRLWLVVALFTAVLVERSAALGLPLRDPEGQMFRVRLAKAVVFLVVLAVLEAVVRARRRDGSKRWSLRSSTHAVGRQLRERWTPRRILLVLTGLLAYHVVYVDYRNLKSWNAFNPLRDDDLLAFDKALFLGHSPAGLLHAILGETVAADVLSVVYRSFTYLVVLSLVASLVLVPQVRRAYLFLCSAVWVWILGTLSYYLLPSLGPYAAAPQDFAGLRATKITETQAEYLVERAHFLAFPGAPDAFVSLGAFASLHVGFTTVVLLMARAYGLRRTARVLGGYLGLVVLATVYFGWHYVVDDVAGVLMAVAAVQLGRWTVDPPFSRWLGRTG